MTEPWASLVAAGAKRVETRDWKPTSLGPLAIRSAINLEPVGGITGLYAKCAEPAFAAALKAADITSSDFAFGHIIALVDIVDCQPTDGLWPLPDEPERSFGDYGPNRWMWQLENIRRLREPIKFDGQPGLPPLPVDIVNAIYAQVA